MAIKDQAMWVGGLGKEWTTTKGEVLNFNPQWVKSIGPTGDVLHHDWVNNYNALREKAGFQAPGWFLSITVWFLRHRTQNRSMIAIGDCFL